MGYAARNKIGQKTRTEREMLRDRVTAGAEAVLREWKEPIRIDTDITQVVALIGTVQLALRHPHAQLSPSMRATKEFVTTLIERIDPTHGDLWKFLNLGFDRRYDT
jgi:hypothetical protein